MNKTDAGRPDSVWMADGGRGALGRPDALADTGHAQAVLADRVIHSCLIGLYRV
jgi:hypothetical protein